MAEIKLEKINERLYHQPRECGDAPPIKWKKGLHLLSFTMTELQSNFQLDITRPETSFSALLRDDLKDSDDPQSAKHDPKMSPEEQEQISEVCEWRIVGKAILNRDRIGVIREDRSVTGREEHYDRLEVTFRPGPELQVGRFDGYISDSTDNLCLVVLVPSARFERFCSELASGRLTELVATVYAELFRSDAESRTFYLEKDSRANFVYLSHLAVSSPSVPREELDNPRDLFHTAGLLDRKVNFFGNRLLDIEWQLKSLWGTVKVSLIFVVIVYLVVTVWNWFRNP